MYIVENTISVKPLINQKWIEENGDKSFLSLYREIYNYFPTEENAFLDGISEKISSEVSKIGFPDNFKKGHRCKIPSQYKDLFDLISKQEFEDYFKYVRRNFIEAKTIHLINAILNDKNPNYRPQAYLTYSDSIKKELHSVWEYLFKAFDNVVLSALIFTYYISKSNFSKFLSINEIFGKLIKEIAIPENFEGGLFSVENKIGRPVPEIFYGVLKELILEKLSKLNKRDENELYKITVKEHENNLKLQEEYENESLQYKQIWALNNLYSELFTKQSIKYQTNNYFSLGGVAYCENNFLDALMFMRKHFEKEYTRKEFKSLLTSDVAYVERFNFKGDISEYQQILHYLMKEKIIKKSKIHEITKERFLFNGIQENRELNTIQKQFNSQKMDMYSKLYQDLVSKFVKK